MTEKEQLIAQVVELSAKLGRDADTTGTVAELKARIEELEAELDDGAGSGSHGGDDGPLTSAPHNVAGSTGTEANQRMVCIIPKVTLHLRGGREPLIAIKDKPCHIDAEQARQVVEVEQLARYVDE